MLDLVMVYPLIWKRVKSQLPGEKICQSSTFRWEDEKDARDVCNEKNLDVCLNIGVCFFVMLFE